MRTAAPLALPRCGGASLIEVLVAILVLSLGLLGLAGMQAGGLKAMQSAQSRSLASLQVQDLIDRMRANRARAAEGAYDLVLGAAPPAGGAVANEDLRQWKEALARTLPGGDGSIERSASAAERERCDRGANCFFWITVQWTALAEDGAAEASAGGILERRIQRLVVVAVL